jgi:hypothetical protein
MLCAQEIELLKVLKGSHLNNFEELDAINMNVDFEDCEFKDNYDE